MTEEDTFNALRRESFRKVAVECFRRAELGRDIVELGRDIIEQSGWDFDEFSTEVNKQISLGNIRANITKVRDPEEQQKFLETGII